MTTQSSSKTDRTTAGKDNLAVQNQGATGQAGHQQTGDAGLGKGGDTPRSRQKRS